MFDKALMYNPMKHPIWDKPLEEVTEVDEAFMSYLSSLDNVYAAQSVAKKKYRDLLKVAPPCKHCNNAHYPHCETGS